jgi:hypothetical protein
VVELTRGTDFIAMARLIRRIASTDTCLGREFVAFITSEAVSFVCPGAADARVRRHPENSDSPAL